jgi:hypothetical protein
MELGEIVRIRIRAQAAIGNDQVRANRLRQPSQGFLLLPNRPHLWGNIWNTNLLSNTTYIITTFGKDKQGELG